ncbi:hypothetical protein L917_20894, partial [Phytophthora nicotianae]
MADIAMTGEAGANRTFRSIFGDQKQQHNDVLKLEQSDCNASVASGAGAAVLAMDDDDDDEAMWSDEPPLNGDATTKDNNDLPGLQFAQRKSMEEWADDDDEEENWKEALQDRVNQLELAFQHNDDSTAAESRRRFEQQQQLQQVSASEPQRVDFSQSLPVPTHLTTSNADSERPRHASRHKMQRTSSSHACITGDNATTSSRPNHLWNFQRKVVGGTPANPIVQDSRTRSHPIDFVARNIQTVEHHRKRSDSLSGSSNRTDSPRQALSRKSSMDSNRSSLSRSNSSSLRGNKAAAPTPSGAAAVLNLSDTEAIRRFVLDDVKTMSMERLVGNAQRLHFLEDFYQNHQGSGTTPAVAPSSPSSPI